MRPFPFCGFCLIAIAAVAGPERVRAAESAAASVSVRAEFREQVALRVSGELLEFEIASSAQEAFATVTFSAAARTRRGGEVVLSVEPLRVAGPGGAADVEAVLTLLGEGEGLLSGDVRRAAPTVAARWHGGGIRRGRLTFALRAASGRYEIPVRFVLSTP